MLFLEALSFGKTWEAFVYENFRTSLLHGLSEHISSDFFKPCSGTLLM